LLAWLQKRLSFLRMASMTAGLVVVFCLLTACSLLPTLEYVQNSNRWGWGVENIMTENLDASNLQTFIHPFFQGSPLDGSYHGRWGFHASTNYIGWVPLALFVAGLFFTNKIKNLTWFLVMGLLFTLLSMGDSTILSNAVFMFFYHYVPFFGHHRTISRMMFLTQFAMACGAGLVLDYWIQRWREKDREKTGIIRKGLPWFALLILLLSFVDLFKFDAPFARTDRDQVFPEPMMQSALDDKGYYRVQPSNRICADLYWHLFQPITYDYTSAGTAADYLSKWDDNPDSPLSDVMAMKYVFHGRIHSTSTRFKPMDPKQPFFWINQQPLPRAFMTGGYQVIAGGLFKAEDMIAGNQFDYRHEILLDKKPEGLPESDPKITGETQITSYTNHEVLIHCQAPAPGLLFLSDINFPGWKAQINGKPAEILNADGLFRAVVIPAAGDYDVRMSYWPTHLTAALIISAIGWAGVLGSLAWCYGRRKTALLAAA
jgi:hypothetical protein